MNTIGAEPSDWDKYFQLMADVDLSGYTGADFNIIGYFADWRYMLFAGVYDGNRHTISNFTHTSTDTSYVGLFGYVEGENAPIKDLTLSNPNLDVRSGHDVGALVGYLRDGTITGCSVEGGSVSGGSNVGGLVGMNYAGEITNCDATGSVDGQTGVSGLAGGNRYSAATITASFWDIEATGRNNMCGDEVPGGGGCDDANGKTTVEMQTANTFLDVGWDLVEETANGAEDIWRILEGQDYPRLWWELIPESRSGVSFTVLEMHLVVCLRFPRAASKTDCPPRLF